MMTPADYFLGLDLGQAQEFTALAVCERPPANFKHGLVDASVYSIRHLRRFPLGTSYTSIVTAVRELTANQVLRGRCAALILDQTGVGGAVVDQFRQASLGVGMVIVTITSGQQVTANESAGGWNVPKKDLVGTLQVLLQNRRLNIARSLPEAPTLMKELETFRIRNPATNNGAVLDWREGQHDDLVFAAGLACWYAEQHPRYDKNSFGGGETWAAHGAPRGVFLEGALPEKW